MAPESGTPPPQTTERRAPTTPAPEASGPDAAATPAAPHPETDITRNETPEEPVREVNPVDEIEQMGKKETSKVIAEALLLDRGEQISQKVASGAINVDDLESSRHKEGQLLQYYMLKRGFPEGRYSTDAAPGQPAKPGIPFINKLRATTTTGDEVDVLYLTEGTTALFDTSGDTERQVTSEEAAQLQAAGTVLEPKKVYTCTVEDPSTPGATKEVVITADEIASRHLAKAAEDIEPLFEGKEKDLVSWAARGAEGDVPLTTEEIATIAKKDAETAPKVTPEILGEVNSKIVKYGAILTAKIEELAKIPPAEVTEEDRKALDRLKNTMARLDLAKSIDGEAGVAIKYALLKGVSESADSLTRGNLDAVFDKLKPFQAGAKDALSSTLAEAGFDEAKIEAWNKTLEKSPELLLLEMTSEKNPETVAKLSQAFFGKELTLDDTTRITEQMNTFIDTSRLSERQKTALKIALNTSKGVGFLLLFLAAFAGAIAVGTVSSALKQQ